MTTTDSPRPPAPRPTRRSRIDVDGSPALAAAKTKQRSAQARERGAPEPRPAKPAPITKTKKSTAKPSPKRISALDAAARVLAGLSRSESREGITAPDLIERMAKARLWKSPSGKTPAATLYAAMIREITKQGSASRFKRLAPGRFTAAPAAKSRAGAKA